MSYLSFKINVMFLGLYKIQYGSYQMLRNEENVNLSVCILRIIYQEILQTAVFLMCMPDRDKPIATIMKLQQTIRCH